RNRATRRGGGRAGGMDGLGGVHSVYRGGAGPCGRGKSCPARPTGPFSWQTVRADHPPESNMAANPKNLAAKIAHFLKNPDNTSFLDFPVGTFHVTPRLYAKVAQRLEKSHAITVEVQALPNNLSGAYDPGANKFYLNPAETADPISLGCTIIHEATHAAADVQKLDLYFVDNEAAGF